MTQPISGTRWTLLYQGSIKTFIVTELYAAGSQWRVRDRSMWKSMIDALNHIEQTNRRRLVDSNGNLTNV